MSATSASTNVRKLKRVAVAILLAGAAIPARAGDANTNDTAQPVQPLPPDILVIGERLFRDVAPERSLDEWEIEAYGLSTIDELLGTIQGELGDDGEAPLIIVDGQRINDISEIGSLPVEALRSVSVLPRGSAVRAGGRSGQRVVSLSLRRKVRSATVTAAPRIATDGEGEGARGEAIYTYVSGKTRANVALRGRGEGALLESDRDIVQRDSPFPYAIGGNVIGYPAAGEIDPLLTEAAGRIVDVVAVPTGANPALADFASGLANATDLGRFRTLRPETRNYDLNGTINAPIAPWLTGSATLRFGRSSSQALRGLPTGLFLLSDTNPASPFSRDVRLAYFGRTPLESRQRRRNGEASVTFNAIFGDWNGDLNARHSRVRSVSISERQSAFGLVAIDDSVDPFASPVDSLIGIVENKAVSRPTTTRIESRLNGPAADLPAGIVQATLEGELAWNRIRSETTYASVPNTSLRRSQRAIRGALDIPLTSRSNAVLPQLGDLSATVELGRVHFSDAGGISNHAFGLTWEPIDPLRLRAAVEKVGTAAPIELLGSPVIVTPNSRVFDPLTGETVDVVQIGGGNPGLDAEQVTTRRLTALLRLVPALKLNLNGEYTDTRRKDFVSSLPEASAAVMLAFPDRFIRDGDGVLTTIDLRPVNFDEAREKRLRWGMSMNFGLGPAARDATRPAPAARRSRPDPKQTMIQFTANHSLVLSEKILIRPELDPVDLLSGGAIGIGGGRVRHQVDGTLGVTSGGAGVRLGFNWRGKSELQTRFAGTTDTLRFSPLFKVNLRAFTDVQRFVPNARWAKGLRLSLDILNVTNDRQEVFNPLGETPLQYQSGYRDPIGRTIEFEIRKVF